MFEHLPPDWESQICPLSMITTNKARILRLYAAVKFTGQLPNSGGLHAQDADTMDLIMTTHNEISRIEGEKMDEVKSRGR